MKKLKTILQEADVQDWDPVVINTTTGEINKKLKSCGIPATYYGKPTPKPKMILKTKIDPKKLGMFAPIFDEIELEVHAQIFPDNPHAAIIKLLYAWKHPSGSNGYTLIYKLTRDEDWREV